MGHIKDRVVVDSEAVEYTSFPSPSFLGVMVVKLLTDCSWTFGKRKKEKKKSMADLIDEGVIGGGGSGVGLYILHDEYQERWIWAIAAISVSSMFFSASPDLPPEGPFFSRNNRGFVPPKIPDMYTVADKQTQQF